MRNRWIGVGLFVAGVIVGVELGGSHEESLVAAQTSWQCRSWALEARDTLAAIEPWVGSAAQLEISTAGLDVANRYVLAACKR